MCLLPGNDVSSLWLSLDKGLCQLNTTNMSYRLFAKNDGLANDNFNTGSGLKLANGELLFGGIKGITAFDPAAISFNKAIAPIYFTGLRLSDSSSNVSTTDKHIIPENIINAKEIVLNYDQNVFTITYALLNYIRPGKNSYQYILEGYNRSWIYTDQPAASFTNVPPGNYVLKVKGANNDGVWGTPISLTLKIRPPFWQRWWAYVLYILLAIALIFLFTRYLFLRAVIKKKKRCIKISSTFSLIFRTRSEHN
ncbi:triple tyrosine motif-containing protein [Niabella hibiscisoli]|uniref:triple tyrosine motif-containing protein n=1 Tax=Niabella hibiscisoli TaxID=1825928 RepID=UPI001F0D138E|nr:triple tyrosine motif-containing protein [Niabella hibiscisoli]MCH5718369.1 hypothetical protein [Niabella hibiscisoli]